MNRHLRRWLPTPEQLQGNRWLRWLGPALLQPRLWRSSRRGIALGMAIGVFFGLLVPIAQMPLSAGAAIVLRANLPSAVASTLVTNPVTFAPVYYAAWRVGSAVLGAPRTGADTRPAPAGFTLGQGLAQVGKPLLLGLAIFACAFGLAVYLLVHAAWVLRVRLKRRRRVALVARMH